MDNIVTVAETLFLGVWHMLLETDFPGTDISLAAISIAVMIAGFAIRIFSYLTGFRGGGATYGRAADAADRAKATYDSKNKRKIGF